MLAESLQLAKKVYIWADRRTGGALEIIRQALHRFNRVRAPEAAASIAYFAIFSMVPLLLLMASVVGYLLVSVRSPEKILDFIAEAFPLARTIIHENILQILQQRGAGGVVGLVGLIWAASGVFTTLARSINRAWPGARSRNFLQGRLLALGMIGAGILLLVLLVLARLAYELLGTYTLPVEITITPVEVLLWNWITVLLPWLVAFAVFILVYRWIPNVPVRWREAFWGAIVATVGWELTTSAFTWYLGSRFSTFDRLYGSLGAGVALLTWIYLSALITLFGAHLSAAIAQATRLKESPVLAQEETSL
jgi:membrane protein